MSHWLLLLLLSSALATGCAHVSRAEALAATRYDVMTDAEVARDAVREALGELHRVEAIDAATGLVTRGEAAFTGRAERLLFEARVEGIIHRVIYGQGPLVRLIALRCEALQAAAWRRWPGEVAADPRPCDATDRQVTVHTLYRKPRLQSAYVDALLGVIDDAAFACAARARLAVVQRAGAEPYVFALEAWEQVEGFRPRG